VAQRFRTFLRWYLIITLAITVLGAIALAWLSQTEKGRDSAARFIEKLIDDEIPGSMTIGRIEHFGTPTLVYDLKFRDPKGALVLEVDRAEIDFDLGAVLEQKLAFHSAKVQGGRVFIAIAPSGRTTMEEALSAPAPEPDPDPHGGLHFAFRNIDVEGVHLMFKGSPDEAYRIRGIRGHLDIVREESIGARVFLKDVSGDLEEKVAGMSVRLVSVSAWIHGGEKQVLDLHALARIGDSSVMKAYIKYYDRAKKPVEIVLSKTNGLQAELMAMLVYFQSMTTADLEVRLEDS
jgi:hypothetical protein